MLVEGMSVEIPAEQCGLEKAHRHGPDRRRAAEFGQRHFGEHGLYGEQQQSGREQRQRKGCELRAWVIEQLHQSCEFACRVVRFYGCGTCCR
jgi:hypothetical protein